MKLLFISSRDVNIKSHGGYQCTNRNYLSFCELLGLENVNVFNLNSDENNSIFHKLLRKINILFGFYPGLTPKKINEIIKISTKYESIFIDSSSYGVISFYLKKNNYKGQIICFFHNVEYKIQLQKAKIKPFGFLMIMLVYLNEKKACTYSDKIIALNKRDSDGLRRTYGASNIIIIPISLFDTLKIHVDKITSTPPTFLFIGNYWYANIHGLEWFVQNVLDNVDIKLQIVGTGMDILRKKFSHPKIEFLGYIPDLTSVLINADYFISPIFLGSGMKVKTCEALMFGKNIIGTKEAFEGYEIDPLKVGAICNNKKEFIHAIENCCSEQRDIFNKYSRQYFLDKYSFKATLTKFHQVIFNNL